MDFCIKHYYPYTDATNIHTNKSQCVCLLVIYQTDLTDVEPKSIRFDTGLFLDADDAHIGVIFRNFNYLKIKHIGGVFDHIYANYFRYYCYT